MRNQGPTARLTDMILSIRRTIDHLTRTTARRPFGVGEFPADSLDFFHWGAFAEPTLWGLVYGAWQVIAASVVASLLPLLLYLVIPEEAANLVSTQLSVMALSGVTSSVARIWAGMNANRFAWQREAQLVERALSGQPRRDIAWYVSRQWRWMLWANVVLVATTVIAATADYQALVVTGRLAAQFAVAQHLLWPVAAYLGAFMVGGRSFLALLEREAPSANEPEGAGQLDQPTGGSRTDRPTPTVVASNRTVALAQPAAAVHRNDVTLHNGVKIPQIGFGTYKIPAGDDTFVATLEALRAGYRHIDTAALYANEESVGEAIQEFGLPRDEVFVTTKVWNDRQGYAETLDAFDDSIDKLGLDYVDLFLVHWPVESTLETTWFALEHLLSAGRVRAIGVCNFDVKHLERLSEVARVAPMVNQFEIHPRFQRPELVTYCRNHGIAIEAWAPLMRGGVFEIPELIEIGLAHGKSAGQVALRWGLQSGFVVLPKSVHPDRIEENLEVFDFELTQGEMDAIGMLDRGERVGPDPDRFSWSWPDSQR